MLTQEQINEINEKAVKPSKHKNEETIKPKIIFVHRLTGEQYESIDEVEQVERIYIREQQDYTDVPSQVDQSQIHENNITELMKKYKPDELAAVLAARNTNRQPIENHDFSQEPNLQESMNAVYSIRKEFEELPKTLQQYFNHKPQEFLKFCENPQNRAQLEKWGLAQKTPATIEALNAIKRNEAENKKQQLAKLKLELDALSSPSQS